MSESTTERASRQAEAPDSVQDSKAEIAALCVGNALGTCVGFVVPLWVAALIREGFLSTATVGWLASAQLFLLAGAGIATSVRGGTFNPRRVAMGLAGVITFATALAAIHAVTTVVAGLCLFAVASGVLHSLMIRAGALRRQAPRVLALMTAAAMGLGAITTFFSRHAMQHIGVSGLFLMIAALSIASGVVMFFGFPDKRFEIAVTPVAVKGQTALSFKLAPVLACMAGALVNMAGATVGTYTLVIGAGLGFTASSATLAMAVSEPFAMLGPLAAHRLGERLGVMRPILLGVGMLAVGQFILINALSIQVYGLAMIINGVTFSFYIPYAMALVGRLDTSGRLVGALPGLMTVGASIGPALGGAVMQAQSFRVLAPIEASLYALALVLFGWAGRQMLKEAST